MSFSKVPTGFVRACPLAPAEESADSSLEQHADVEAKAWLTRCIH